MATLFDIAIARGTVGVTDVTEWLENQQALRYGLDQSIVRRSAQDASVDTKSTRPFRKPTLACLPMSLSLPKFLR